MSGRMCVVCSWFPGGHYHFVNVLRQLTSLTVLYCCVPEAHGYLAPPTDLAVSVLSDSAVKVYWTLPFASSTSFSRVTLTPAHKTFRLMEDVPLPATPFPLLMQVKFDRLSKGSYEVIVQSGDEDMVLSEESASTYFQLNLSHISDAFNGSIDWSKDPYGWTGVRTEEIVIVSLVLAFWVVAIFAFCLSWKKIRVIEPRYFDYKFLMRYDKAFALRNAVISATVTNGPRRSLGGRSIIFMPNGASGAARFSLSGASMRNNDEDLPEFNHPAPSARRQSVFLNPASISTRRMTTHENRIHFDELFKLRNGRLSIARDSIASV